MKQSSARLERKEKRSQCQFSDDHFWSKVEMSSQMRRSVIAKWKCHREGGGGKSQKKDCWDLKESEVWLWKRRSEVEEILFHWLYNRPTRMFPDRKPPLSLSLHPQYCLSAGHEPEILLPRGDLFCQPHIFVSLSVVGKLQEQNIFHKFTFWSTLRIWTAQCHFGIYYIKLDLPLIF